MHFLMKIILQSLLTNKLLLRLRNQNKVELNLKKRNQNLALAFRFKILKLIWKLSLIDYFTPILNNFSNFKNYLLKDIKIFLTNLPH